MSANGVAKAFQRLRELLRDCVNRKAAIRGAIDHGPPTWSRTNSSRGYLDDRTHQGGTTARHLNDWLAQSPDNARRFALAMLLHDRSHRFRVMPARSDGSRRWRDRLDDSADPVPPPSRRRLARERGSHRSRCPDREPGTSLIPISNRQARRAKAQLDRLIEVLASRSTDR